MTAKRIPLEEQAAALLAAAPNDTAPPQGARSGRLEALTTLVRPATFRLPPRLLSWAVLSALVCVLVLVAVTTLPTLLGYHNYIVSGGSMGAGLPQGSVAVTKPTSPYALDIGDIIARRDSPDGAPVLHRIIDIRVEEGVRLFTTQGDANRTPDPEPVILEGPGDRVVYGIPYVGYVLRYSGSSPGRIVLIGVPLALLAAIFARERWQRAQQPWEASIAAVSERPPIPATTRPDPVQEGRLNTQPVSREQLERRRRAKLGAPPPSAGGPPPKARPGEPQEEQRVA